MEEEYIEKKIKEQLINKDFKLWDKESIDFLLSIFENEKYNMFYNVNLMLLNDYIQWYSKNNNINDNVNNNINEKCNHYSLENLKYIYCLVNEDIYNNVHYDYIKTLNNLENKVNGLYKFTLFENLLNILNDKNFCSLTIGIIATIIYIIFNFIIKIFTLEKKNEKRHIFEIKIPIPDNLINNSLIKFFLDNKFNI
jgi:hypothetical protein